MLEQPALDGYATRVLRGAFHPSPPGDTGRQFADEPHKARGWRKSLDVGRAVPGRMGAPEEASLPPHLPCRPPARVFRAPSPWHLPPARSGEGRELDVVPVAEQRVRELAPRTTATAPPARHRCGYRAARPGAHARGSSVGARPPREPAAASREQRIRAPEGLRSSQPFVRFP